MRLIPGVQIEMPRLIELNFLLLEPSIFENTAHGGIVLEDDTRATARGLLLPHLPGTNFEYVDRSDAVLSQLFVFLRSAAVAEDDQSCQQAKQSKFPAQLEFIDPNILIALT
jgi:hypothetical protein